MNFKSYKEYLIEHSEHFRYFNSQDPRLFGDSLIKTWS